MIVQPLGASGCEEELRAESQCQGAAAQLGACREREGERFIEAQPDGGPIPAEIVQPEPCHQNLHPLVGGGVHVDQFVDERGRVSYLPSSQMRLGESVRAVHQSGSVLPLSHCVDHRSQAVRGGPDVSVFDGCKVGQQCQPGLGGQLVFVEAREPRPGDSTPRRLDQCPSHPHHFRRCCRHVADVQQEVDGSHRGGHSRGASIQRSEIWGLTLRGQLGPEKGCDTVVVPHGDVRSVVGDR